MGGSRWLSFKKGEISKAKKFLADIATIDCAEPETRVWIDWKVNRLDISYSFGYPYHTECSCIVAREVAKRFKVKRLGADSTGWYEEEFWNSDEEVNRDDAIERYGRLFPSWAEWTKNYSVAWSSDLSHGRKKLLNVKEEASIRDALRKLDYSLTRFFVELDEKRGKT